MATRPTIPYFAPADSLPAPLPSIEEIRRAAFGPNVTPPETVLVYIEPHFAIRYGTKVPFQEGENMLFVRQSTSVPVQTVYALLRDEETDSNIIVFERIKADDLETVWPTLEKSQKDAIASQIRRHFDELRSLPSPGYYGGVWRQPILDELLNGNLRRGSLPPPEAVETEEQWAALMVDRGAEYHADHPERLEWMKQTFRSLLKGHRPVFTHGEFHRAHFLVRPDLTVVVIEWTKSGWYPSFWEYCISRLIDPFRDDWARYVPQMLPGDFAGEVGWILMYNDWIECGLLH